jgi:hypothetical protein
MVEYFFSSFLKLMQKKTVVISRLKEAAGDGVSISF